MHALRYWHLGEIPDAGASSSRVVAFRTHKNVTDLLPDPLINLRVAFFGRAAQNIFRCGSAKKCQSASPVIRMGSVYPMSHSLNRSDTESANGASTACCSKAKRTRATRSAMDPPAHSLTFRGCVVFFKIGPQVFPESSDRTTVQTGHAVAHR